MRINPEKNFLFGEKVSNMGQYVKMAGCANDTARRGL